MRLITRQVLANNIALVWSYQYPSADPYWGSKQGVLLGLLALGETPDPDEVDKVIGNDTWTKTMCYECKDTGVDVVEVGDEPDYDSQTTSVCKKCLKEALDL